MKVTIEDYETGWFGVGIGISEVEVDHLIKRLTALKEKRFDHFAIVSNEDAQEKGIENIEIFLLNEEDSENMSILGGDISPSS